MGAKPKVNHSSFGDFSTHYILCVVPIFSFFHSLRSWSVSHSLFYCNILALDLRRFQPSNNQGPLFENTDMGIQCSSWLNDVVLKVVFIHFIYLFYLGGGVGGWGHKTVIGLFCLRGDDWTVPLGYKYSWR